MNRIKALCLAAAAGTVAICSMVAPVSADSISVGLVSVLPSGSGTYLWTYEGTLSAGSSVVPGTKPGPGIVATSSGVGDWFTVNDFGGFVKVITTPAGWGFDSYAFGATNDTAPYASTPDGGTANLMWYASTFATSTPGPFGLFVAESKYGSQELGFYTSRDHTGGVAAGHGGRVMVPVPVPAAAWAGIVLMGAIGTNKLRKRRKAALC